MNTTMSILASNSIGIWLPIVSLIIVTVLGIFSIRAFYKKVPESQAMIRHSGTKSKIAMSGMFVFPIAHRLEFVDLSEKHLHFTFDPNEIKGSQLEIKLLIKARKSDPEIEWIISNIGAKASFSEAEIQNQTRELVLYILKELLSDETNLSSTDSNSFNNELRNSLATIFKGYETQVLEIENKIIIHS